MSELDPVSVAVEQIRSVEPGTTLDSLMEQLSEDQATALEEIKARKSIKSAAATIGVDRSTVFRWIAHDPYFKAAYHAWKQEVRESAKAQVAGMLDMAVANVENALASGDKAMSYRILKDQGFLVKEKDLATDPALVRQQIAADLAQHSPLSDPRALTAMLAQAGLSRSQQKQLLAQALRPLESEPSGAA
jgi:hypothetical protein